VRLGYDFVHGHAKERFQLFLTTFLAMYSVAGVLMALWMYKWVTTS
jgi:hypothetical protein